MRCMSRSNSHAAPSRNGDRFSRTFVAVTIGRAARSSSCNRTSAPACPASRSRPWRGSSPRARARCCRRAQRTRRRSRAAESAGRDTRRNRRCSIEIVLNRHGAHDCTPPARHAPGARPDRSGLRGIALLTCANCGSEPASRETPTPRPEQASRRRLRGRPRSAERRSASAHGRTVQATPRRWLLPGYGAPIPSLMICRAAARQAPRS
jgi:hypothetical protein